MKKEDRENFQDVCQWCGEVVYPGDDECVEFGALYHHPTILCMEKESLRWFFHISCYKEARPNIDKRLNDLIEIINKNALKAMKVAGRGQERG